MVERAYQCQMELLFYIEKNVADRQAWEDHQVDLSKEALLFGGIHKRLDLFWIIEECQGCICGFVVVNSGICRIFDVADWRVLVILICHFDRRVAGLKG